ncbi:hypothetical protein [Bacillus sinesaloumensis]|uniref:hypothetical protein n=1 Tax=Litchfieldia sinesaloumensis TaxID=1926280 RepID=UPI00098834FA|nr:hypothetical protein [Bacillus sinesaloumensis]
MSNEHEDFDIKEEESQESPKSDPFDRLMFGQRAKRMEWNNSEEHTHVNQTDGADYTQLLNQLGDIMTSIDNLKPLLKELSPLLDYFRKK